METNIKLKLAALKYLGLTNIVPSLEQVFKTRLEAAGYKVYGSTHPSKHVTQEAKPNYDTADPKKVFISITVEHTSDFASGSNTQEYQIDWNIGYRDIAIPHFIASATIPEEDDTEPYDEMYGEREWEGDTELAPTSETSGYKYWDAHIEELIDILDTAK